MQVRTFGLQNESWEPGSGRRICMDVQPGAAGEGGKDHLLSLFWLVLNTTRSPSCLKLCPHMRQNEENNTTIIPTWADSSKLVLHPALHIYKFNKYSNLSKDLWIIFFMSSKSVNSWKNFFEKCDWSHLPRSLWQCAVYDRKRKDLWKIKQVSADGHTPIMICPLQAHFEAREQRSAWELFACRSTEGFFHYS